MARSPADRLMIAWQIGLVAAAALIGMAPPAEGMMLVLPIKPASGGETVRWAVAAGARLVSPGPVEGAYIVFGKRAALLPTAALNGAIVMRAGAAGCGTRARKQI